MNKLSIEQYDQLINLTHQWLSNRTLEDANHLQGAMSKILNCTPENALGELDSKFPEIYEELTRPSKEHLAEIYPQWFPEYVK
jgi:hypothetical protein